MRSAIYLISTLAAFTMVRTNADGVCYDPKHGLLVTPASMTADMQTIKAKGFSHVRTYETDVFGFNLADIVIKAGLRAALGIPHGVDNNQVHIDNAIKAANANNATAPGGVDYIFVGNEDVMDLGDKVSVIKYIKARVPGNVKVGTVQTPMDYIRPSPGMSEVVAASDVVGVNIHPFMTTLMKPELAIQETQWQWLAVQKSGLPGIESKLILTETGWPSDGQYASNQGSVESAEAYWWAYRSWNFPGKQRFYYQAFDTPYKVGFEAKYGLLNANSTPKFPAAGNLVV